MKKLLLALPFLLAGCQSERVAFRFQPGAPAAGTARAGSAAPAAGLSPAPRAGLAAEATGAPAGAAAEPPAAAPLAAAQPTRRRNAPAQLPRLALAALATAGPLAAPRPLPRLLLKRLTRQHATAGPAHTTENGLAGIALFFLGVALAVLAGLGLLLSLIPGISFWGGVGLAAAGLLVLFVLYSLVSGGGKQKKAPAR